MEKMKMQMIISTCKHARYYAFDVINSKGFPFLDLTLDFRADKVEEV